MSDSSDTDRQNAGSERDATDFEPNMSWDDFLNVLEIHKLPHDIQEVDVLQKRLPTQIHWNHFYDSYSKWTGFSVRRQHVRRNTNKEEWQRLYVCSREGFRRKKWVDLPGRKNEPRAITRIGCMASLQVTLDKESRWWTATSFNHIHNHDLASPSEIQFLRSHRVVPPSVVEQAKAMRRAGIRTMNILDFVSHQFGGRHKLPFVKRDLYNKLSNDRRKVAEETDCEGALGYLTCLAIRDENFFCRFNVDDECRLHTIFWADGASRADYNLFGDVLAFDTTYRTNAYNKPLMLMVGVNNHYRTTIFAIALLPDETTSTFSWVLEQFLICMNDKRPHVVLTDGDHAMRSAILDILPTTIHRLCSWHLETNAASNVPNGDFKLGFSKLMYHYYTEQEFDETWATLVQEHNLDDNDWVVSLYEKRKSWAETFLRGNFVGGMRTTQRCESMNSYLRRFLESKHLLRDFVSQIDQSMQALRHSDMQADFNSKHTQPLFPESDPLLPYYKQVAATFTRNIYFLFANQIQAQNSFSVSSVDYSQGHPIFTLTKFQCGEIRHHVHYNPVSGHINCTCLLFETDGIPCRHIFAVMKHQSISLIPPSLIRPCWRKDIKNTIHTHEPSNHFIPQDVVESARMASLTSEFQSLSFLASKFPDTFSQATEDVRRLVHKYQLIISQRQPQLSAANTFDEDTATRNNIVRDPVVAKTKGREKDTTNQKKREHVPTGENRRNKCSVCQLYGHNKQTCAARHITTSTTEFNSSQETHPFNSYQKTQPSHPYSMTEASQSSYGLPTLHTQHGHNSPNDPIFGPNVSTRTPDDSYQYWKAETSNRLRQEFGRD